MDVNILVMYLVGYSTNSKGHYGSTSLEQEDPPVTSFTELLKRTRLQFSSLRGLNPSTANAGHSVQSHDPQPSPGGQWRNCRNNRSSWTSFSLHWIR